MITEETVERVVKETVYRVHCGLCTNSWTVAAEDRDILTHEDRQPDLVVTMDGETTAVPYLCESCKAITRDRAETMLTPISRARSYREAPQDPPASEVDAGAGGVGDGAEEDR